MDLRGRALVEALTAERQGLAQALDRSSQECEKLRTQVVELSASIELIKTVVKKRVALNTPDARGLVEATAVRIYRGGVMAAYDDVARLLPG